ncbi:DUF6195 family protein [Streptomyces tubercidicus]|uniref:DUF6195 family protein n=1 Tax=Streptomyces tubercidicus TaxID=47759 RepID=UPI0036914571
MTHPIMLAAADELTTAEGRRIAERDSRWRSWGPRSVTAAAAYARVVLGAEAATLEWEVLGLLPFEGHLQAVAVLDTVGGQRMELYYSGEGDVERLMLRVSCTSCPSQMVEEVTSLEGLGQLLSQTPAWKVIAPRTGGEV